MVMMYLLPPPNKYGVPEGDTRYPRHTVALLLAGIVLFILSAIVSVMVIAQFVRPMPRVVSPEEIATSTPMVDHFATMQLQAKAAYVYDMSTHTVLYQRNAEASLPLASLSKVMTALVVSEVLDASSTVAIPHYLAAPTDPNSGLLKGEQYTVRDVLSFTLVASSNDGAEFLASLADTPLHVAYPLSPIASTTIWRMNSLAAQLGLMSMRFTNVSGLDLNATTASNVGSARDMAGLLQYAASTSVHTFAGTVQKTLTISAQHGASHTFNNTDEALAAIPGVVLGKTGYTDLAGGNLAVVFNVGLHHPIVAVVLGSTEEGRFDDMKALVNATIATVSSQENSVY